MKGATGMKNTSWWRQAIRSLAQRMGATTVEKVVVYEEVGPPNALDREDYGWRTLTRDDRRDLSPVRHDKMLRLANYLWASNPIAKRAASNIRSLVASEGFQVRATSTDEAARKAFQRFLDRHWEINQWDELLDQRVETLGVEGEWIYLVPPANAYSGQFELAKLLPENVEAVIRCEVNAERLKAIKLYKPIRIGWTDRDGCKHWVEKDLLEIAYRDRITGEIKGEVLFLGVNRLSGQTRGWSDLMVVADMLDQLDQLLYTETERVQFQRAFIWDVEVEGGEEVVKATQERLKKEGPPKPASVNVHNKAEKWDPKVADLKLADSVTFLKFVQMICFGGLHMPEHWFAEANTVNRASAGAMQTPLYAHARSRKAQVHQFISLAIEIAVDRGNKAGALQGVPLPEQTWELVSRDPDRSAFDVIGEQLRALAESLTVGLTIRLLTHPEAARIYRTAATQLGLGDFLTTELPDPAAGTTDETLDQAISDTAGQLTAHRTALEKMKPLALALGNGGTTNGKIQEN